MKQKPQTMKKNNQPTRPGNPNKAVRILRAAGRFLIILGQFIRIVKKKP